MSGTFTELHPLPTHDPSGVPLAGPSPFDAIDELVELQNRLAQAESEARDAAAILDLVGKLQATGNLDDACFTLVNELQKFLGCRRVAIGLVRRKGGACRLTAVSELAHFDKRSETTQQIESAFDESILRNGTSCWPAVDDADRHASLSLTSLGARAETQRAVCTPMRDEFGKVVGACLFEFDDTTLDGDQTRNLISELERPLGTCLGLLARLERGRVARCVYAVSQFLGTHRGKAIALVTGLLLASLAIPWTHHIDCECRLEPVTRRFVAAPFEGTLDESFVKPGDLVSKGDVLARLDGREIRWKRAGLIADQKQAAKKRDSELAAHKFAEAQIAKLEMERLGLEIQLLDHHENNLEIASPIDGVVTSGDLERTVGAPVTIGQNLFEIAPLDRFIVEIAIDQRDIAYVTRDMHIKMRLDSMPGKLRNLKLTHIHPRSETRDNVNVFIAEAVLENGSQLLRPGMDGRAKIVSSRRPLGWVLFHRPWESLTMWMGW